jgi:uncharacterized protein YecT (DUF1311 family)
MMTMLRLAPLALILLMTPAMAQTQYDLNQSNCNELNAANKMLNSTYQKVLNRHKSNAAETSAIKKSQKAWLAFRDAQLEAIYPGADNFGSSYPMCFCIESTALAEARIQQLSQWLKPREGDVCGGSRY